MTSLVVLLALIGYLSTAIAYKLPGISRRCSISNNHEQQQLPSLVLHSSFSDEVSSSSSSVFNGRRWAALLLTAATNLFSLTGDPFVVLADTSVTSSAPITSETVPQIKVIPQKVNVKGLKVPYNHENLPFGDFLGKKATIVFNMKIDDPQTVTQFPTLLEIYKKYSPQGLNVHAFPTEQGWFEPDDDETCRAKGKEYYGFGDYPSAVVFDKVDLLGPSANPLYSAITKGDFSHALLLYINPLTDDNPCHCMLIRLLPRQHCQHPTATVGSH